MTWYLEAIIWYIEAITWYLEARTWYLEAITWYLEAITWYLEAITIITSLEGIFSHLQTFKTRHDFQVFLWHDVRWHNLMFLFHYPIWVIVRILLSVSWCFLFVFCLGFSFSSHLFIHAVGKKSSLTEVRRAQIVTLHGEGFTERDIATKLRCSKITVHSAIAKSSADGTFHETLVNAQWDTC